MRELVVARPIDEWHEDIGPCLWWSFPVEEPPYAGTPLDCNFPNYVTHFTRIVKPDKPISAVCELITAIDKLLARLA